MEGEIATLENEVKKLKEEAYKEDTKISLAKYNSYFIDMLNARMLAEVNLYKYFNLICIYIGWLLIWFQKT